MEGFPVLDIRSVFLDNPIIFKEPRCVLTCILEELEIIKNGDINFFNLVELLPIPMSTNDLMNPRLLAIANKCKPEVDPAKCEFSYKLVTCFTSVMSNLQSLVRF